MIDTTQQNAENRMRIEQFKIKKLINRLGNAQTNGTSAISLIIPPKKSVNETTKMLTEEFGKAANIQDRVNRQSVERAITSVRERLKFYTKAPVNGLILYCGSILEADGKTEKKVMIDFEPYKPINTSKYFCDSKFHVEDLDCLLEVDQPFGFIIMDGHGCLYGKLQGNNREVLTRFNVDLPKKHGRGGQSSVRFARLRKEKRHNYVRKVCEVAAQCFLYNDKVNCVGIVVAGSADFKNELVESANLDQRLQKSVIAVVDVSYGGENGLQQAIELSSQSLSNVKYMQEKKMISKFFEEIAIDTGKYVYGIQDTMKMLENGSMETVMVYEQLEAYRVTLKNKESGVLSYTYLRPDQINDPKHYQDPLTKQEMYESIEQTQLTEWLAENYQQFGCNLQFVTDKSPEGFQFVKGFAGIGGFLRFKMEIDFLYQAEIAGNKLDDDDDFI